MKIKRLIYFFTPQDEERLSCALRQQFPDLKFLDDNRWATETPLEVGGLHLCKSHYAYLWNKAIFANLTIKEFESGVFQGPSTRQVIQFQRNQIKNNFMQSAQLSISYDETNEQEKYFSEKLYGIVKKQHSGSLNLIELESGTVIQKGINNFVLGIDAAELAKKELCLTLAFGQNRILKPG